MEQGSRQPPDNASRAQPDDRSRATSNSDTVSYVNPHPTGVLLNDNRDAAPDAAASLDALTWTTEPMIEDGALVAAGTLTQGARLSEPTSGEPSAFSVYYGANTEVMVELLLDLGATYVWDTDATVAPTKVEQEGDEFTLRAYLPLFMDVGPSDLVMREAALSRNGGAGVGADRRCTTKIIGCVATGYSSSECRAKRLSRYSEGAGHSRAKPRPRILPAYSESATIATDADGLLHQREDFCIDTAF